MDLKHIAFIMDGNGRWAQKQGKPRIFGHEKGMNKIEEVCQWCKEYNIKYGSFFAFSKENWNRPKSEVDFIFYLIEQYYKYQIEKLISNKIKFIHIGDKKELPDKTNSILSELENLTRENESFVLLFFFNYSAREEIEKAALNYSKNIEKNNDFHFYLYTSQIPDPDLLIRTSGEMRISNFLLYQIAYTELYFESQFWPEYSKDHFVSAIQDYRNRKRRFGRIDNNPRNNVFKRNHV